MNIVLPCGICGNSFTPMNTRQKYCHACVHKPCEQCGAKKDVRAKICKACSNTMLGERAKHTEFTARKEQLPAIICPVCNLPFIPRNVSKVYCVPCVNKPCIICGKHKDVRADRCKHCDGINRIGKSNEWSKRKEKSIEQLISEVEAFGLLPEKQYAFGYIIGVMFGDGAISKVIDRVKSIHVDNSIGVCSIESYRIHLEVSSQAFAERVARQWEILTGRKVKVWSYIRTDFSKSTLKSAPKEYSLQLFKFGPRHVLLARYLAYLKYECEPTVLLNRPVETLQGIIDGIVDSEGYVCKEYLDITNKNIALLDVLVTILHSLGYPAKVYTYPYQTASHLRTLPYRVKYEDFE